MTIVLKSWNRLKLCKIMILNLVSWVYKEYIIYYCAATARVHQKVKNILFLKVPDCLPPFLKVPLVSAFQKPNFQIQNKVTNHLCNLPLFHIQSSILSLYFFFLTILQNLNLHWLVFLEANQSIWVEKNCIYKLQPTGEWSMICNFEVFFVARSYGYVVLQFLCIFLHINTT
jgi:hypothetical protein